MPKTTSQPPTAFDPNGCSECSWLFGDHHPTCTSFLLDKTQMHLPGMPARVAPQPVGFCEFCSIHTPALWVGCINHLAGHRICPECEKSMYKANESGPEAWAAWESTH